MRARLIQIDNDYPAIRDWYRARKLPELPAMLFSPLTVVVEDDGGRLLCAVVNYRDRFCPAGAIGWAVGNPAIPKRMLAEAFRVAFERSLREFRACGCMVVVSRLVNRSFSRILKNLGGKVTAETMEEISWVCPF